MTDNPFATEKSWDVSTDTILPEGDWRCTIMEVDGTETSSGGHPQIVVRVGNDAGSSRDWIVVIPTTIGKVTQLTDAAGLERPTDEQVVPEGSGYRLDAAYLQQLLGKEVGVVIRREPDRLDPAKTRDRVKGYVPADKIYASDIPGDTAGLPGNGGDTPSPQTVPDDDIPF